MGLHDSAHAFEQWLLTLVASAFFFRLPDGFLPRVIVQDLTAAAVAAFHSPRTLSGDDYLRHLLRPIDDFARASAENVPLNMQQHLTADAPADPLDLRADMETTIPHVGTRPIFVYARDNGRYMPASRRMVHDERYDTVAVQMHKQNGTVDEGDDLPSAKDTPFTRDEIASNGFHVCKGRPMPGAIRVNNTASEFDGADDLATVRRRAARTHEIKDAYQHYAAWGVAEELKLPRASAASATDERFVIVDTVLSDFPRNSYSSDETKSLADLPSDWSRGKCDAPLIELRSGQMRGRFQTPRIGETDLKLAWYAEHLGKPGDHILLRCNDSDMLFLLLLHAERWLADGRVVFLDMMPQADKRLKHRYVCITELYRGLVEVAAKRWRNMPDIAVVLTFIALLSGSDYTQNRYYISAKAIVAAFERDEGWECLHDLVIGHIDVETPEENQVIWDAVFKGGVRPPSRQWPALVLMDEQVADKFVRLLYQDRIGQAFLMKEFNIPRSSRLSWAQIEVYTKKRFASNKTAARYTVPSERDHASEIRRIYCVILYWMNAHVGLGPFPDALTYISEDDASLWGWRNVPKYATTGAGLARTTLNSVEEALRSNASRKSVAEICETARKGFDATLLHPWVIAHTNYVADYACIWNALYAEWIDAVNCYASA